MYQAYQQNFLDSIAHVKNNIVKDPHGERVLSGRMILKGGMVVDPYNQIEMKRILLLLQMKSWKLLMSFQKKREMLLSPVMGYLLFRD